MDADTYVRHISTIIITLFFLKINGELKLITLRHF